MELLIFLFRLIAPPVDEANVRTAQELGVTEFLDSEGFVIECASLPLDEQPYDCVDRMRWALLTISNRESAGNWSPERRYTGVHHGDSHHADNVKHWAGKFGRLSWWCPSHWTSDGMSTVGPHGLMYGYTVQHLEVPGNCVPTWAFGLGPVSARAAGALYLKRCGEEWGWCPSVEQVVRTRKRARAKGYA